MVYAAMLFGILLVFFFLGVPLMHSIISTSSIFLLLTELKPLTIIPQKFIGQMDSFTFMAVPMFIFSGYLMDRGGISKRLVDWVKILLGGLPGHLGAVAIVCCAIFASLTGSGPATVAAIGGILIAPMVKDGYPKEDAVGLVAAGATLGPIIPPSIPMITYGVTMGVSIPMMFAGGIAPGILIAIVFLIVNHVMAKRKYHFKGEKSNATFKDFLKATGRALGVLLLPVVVLGGIYTGIFTPTEAAAVAVAMSLALGWIYKELTLRSIYECMVASIPGTALCTCIMGAAGSFTWLMSVTRIPQQFVQAVLPFLHSPALYMFLLIIVLLIVGALMDTLTSIILLAPILVPVGEALGWDSLHLGLTFCICMIVGFITPPFGCNLFTSVAVTGLSFNKVVKGVIPYMIVEILLLFIIAYFPQINLLFPRLFMGYGG